MERIRRKRKFVERDEKWSPKMWSTTTTPMLELVVEEYNNELESDEDVET